MFVIRYTGSRPGYFTGWAGRVLPRLGGNRDDAVRFETIAEAEREIFAMPAMAGLMCDVEEVAK